MTEHPVTATLRRCGELWYRECSLGAVAGTPAGPGWLALDILGRDDRRLDRVLALVGRDVGSERRDVQASLFLESLAWTALLPLAAAVIVDRRAFRLARASVRLTGDGRASAIAVRPGPFWALHGDECAGHPDAQVLGAEPDLSDALRAHLLTDFQPVIAKLSARSGRPLSALWRTLGDRAAMAFLYAGEAAARRGAAERVADRVLRGPGPLRCRPRYVRLDGPDGPMRAHARRGCCLWWRTPAAAKCLTCPLNERRSPRP